MGKFVAELRQDVNRMQKQMDFVWKRSVSSAFNEVIFKTPVDTGVARRSWLIGFSDDGNVGKSELNVKPQDIPPVGSSFLLYSNIDYIEYLEDGSSEQAPSGMVKTTVANFDNIVARYASVAD